MMNTEEKDDSLSPDKNDASQLSQSEIKFARVKFITDNIIKTVPIVDIDEFESVPPKNLHDYSRTSIYSCWYSDERNKEKTKYGVIIGCLAHDEDSAETNRPRFARLEQSIINEYNNKSLINDECSSDDEITSKQLKQKSETIATQNELELLAKKMGEKNGKKMPLTPRCSVKLLDLKDDIKTKYDKQQKPAITVGNASVQDLSEEVDDEGKKKEIEMCDESLQTRDVNMGESEKDLAEQVKDLKRIYTAQQQQISVLKHKVDELEHCRLLKRNIVQQNSSTPETPKSKRGSLIEQPSLSPVLAKGYFKVEETSEKNIEKSEKNIEKSKKKKNKLVSFMIDETESKRKFTDKYIDKDTGERMMYLRHGYDINAHQFNKIIETSKNDSIFVKKMLRYYYKPEEIVKKCIYADEKKKTPNGNNQRTPISPKRIDAIKKALSFCIKEKDPEVTNENMGERLQKKNVQKYITEEINVHIKRFKAEKEKHGNVKD